MDIIKLTLLSLLSFLIIGCSTSKGSLSKKDSNPNIQYTSLVQLLRGKPNLKITGNGDNLSVIIRGERSLLGNNEPIYMLDDVVIGNTYKEAASGIDPSDVARVEVITPPNAGRFGARGGNGVIVFRSKRKR